MSPIEQYWKLIEKGEILVSNKIYLAYKYLAYNIENPKGKYFYSPKRANHAIDFIEKYCKHSKGSMGGKPFLLELWQKAMIATIFGFIDINGNRQYRECILIIGKKNGKSTLAAAIGLYCMVADGEAGPEIYAAATKKDQSKIIWGEAKRMVRKSPMLRRRIKCLVGDLNSEFNDGVFKPLAADSDTLDGLNIHCALMDEIHQWKNGKALYNILADGITAREEPLILITSTAGTVREDIYDEKYDEAERIINGLFDNDGYHDEHVIPFVYELDNRKEWVDSKCWIKANPGLGTIKKYEQLEAKVIKAKANPTLVKNLVCKEFNIRETSTEAWLTFEQLNNTAKYKIKGWKAKCQWEEQLEKNDSLIEVKPRYGIGGADLSSTTDLTAAKVLFMVPGDKHIYTLSMYWIAEELVEQRVKEDKIPYDIWIEQGYIRTCPGNKVHHKYVTQWFLELQNERDIYIPWTGYDSWSAEYWVEEMKYNFGKESMIPVIQGKKTLSAPMKRLGADLESKIVVYNNNPVDKWCLANTAVDEDTNGNIQPCKTSKRTKRIDGTAALLDAYVILEDKMEEYQSMI